MLLLVVDWIIVIAFCMETRKIKSSAGDLTAYIQRYQTCEERETPRMIRFKSYRLNTQLNTVQI